MTVLDLCHFHQWRIICTVSFIDNLSRNTWIYFLKKKFEVFDKFKKFNALVENQA